MLLNCYVILRRIVNDDTEIGSAVMLYLGLMVFRTMVSVNGAGNFWLYGASGHALEKI